MNKLKIMPSLENSNFPYHELDPTTPWHDWLCYCEICYQLRVVNQPSVGRFIRYRKYLKKVGVLTLGN